MEPKRQLAFTLIELLVVIAILTLLAGILFPVFAQAREKARQTTCASNLRQLGLAFAQYEQDYDEMLPVGGHIDTVPGPGWAGELFAYVASNGVYTCPSDITNMDASTFGGGGQLIELSYGYNINCAQADVRGVSGSLARFHSPSRTVLVFETMNTPAVPSVLGAQLLVGVSGTWSSVAGNGYSGQLFKFDGGATGIYATGVMGGRPGTLQSPENPLTASGIDQGAFNSYGARHSGGSNFLMADGHVKWLPGAQVSTGDAALNDHVAQDPTYPYTPTISRAEGTNWYGHAVTFSPT